MKKVRLGDIATVITKGTTPTTLGYNFADDGVNFVKIESITENGEFLTDKFAHITDECDRKLSRSQLQRNDLLFSIAGAIGRTAIVKEEILPANTNQALAIIRVPEGVVDYSYLKYVLQSPTIVEQFEKKKQGVAQLNISLKDIGDFVIPLSTAEEQKTVVSTLDKVSELIALRKEQLTKLDQLVKSRFIELFDDKYETKPLQAVCEELFAGGDVKKEKSSDIQSNVYPYPIYTNGEKDNGLYGYTSIVRVSKEAVTISGRGTIGFTCLRKEPFYPAVRLIVAIPKQELVSGCYLQHFIQSKNYGGQGASIPQLTVPMIKDEPIPVPPMELQEQFAAFIEQTDKSKLAIQQSLDKLELLKKSLMQEYFG